MKVLFGFGISLVAGLVSAPSAYACMAYTYGPSLEDMIKAGAPDELVLKEMIGSLGYNGAACYYQFKGAAQKHYPNLYILLNKYNPN